MMMDTDAGRAPTGPGSIAFGDEAATRLRPSGDDPLRGELLALAERCEKATGPDRDLDLAIFHVAQAKRFRWAEFGGAPAFAGQKTLIIEEPPEWLARVRRRGEDVSPGYWEPDVLSLASYTTSLDAAMTLVPEGMAFLLDWVRYTDRKNDREIFWEAYVQWIDDAVNRGNAEADTPALALCAAALRARAMCDSDTHPKGGDASGSGSAE